ncbi:chromosome segregation ATPase [Geitlerinema sp. PCC 9228]|uniref:chromosome segregation ATPase n=1 Tax=Geitlerinema sp. PCC 9228 TaxID=111611 RepID=UPI001114AA3D|nr:chromosome segregation ATPase [Geitlerinema sp. PCC 9228]
MSNFAPSDTNPPLGNHKKHRKRRGGIFGWQFLLVLTALIFGGVGFFSMSMLLKLPSRKDCSDVFWPVASASMRLYCAQVEAEEETLSGYLQAIKMVRELDANHPMRQEINRHLKNWYLGILQLAEKSFQQGELKDAIATARRIPLDQFQPAEGDLQKMVRDRIDKWQSTWNEAEKIYNQTQAYLRREQWQEAFQESLGLLSVGNQYWETTKYKELEQKIQAARKDGNRLSHAREIAKSGKVSDLVSAIRLLENIDENSALHQEAQNEIREIGHKLLDAAEAQLENQNLSQALSIARRIPSSANLEAKVQDFTTLAKARSLAWQQTVVRLEDAIAQAQKISANRPMYAKAQRLIRRWRLNIDDLLVLERAEQLAAGNNISDWQAAISQASEIPPGNPLWEKAQERIDGWRASIQRQQDRPILRQANEYAQAGDIDSLEKAIRQANLIAPNRALYQEAQANIERWQDEIERQQDQPYIDEAKRYANQGDLETAIEIAQEIRPGRVLYSQAQSLIELWRQERQDQQNLQQAYRLARRSSPDALLKAIEHAHRVSNNSPWRSQAETAIAQWSRQVLGMAQDLSEYDIRNAIDLAERIPEYTPAHQTAQRNIERWQLLLNPPKPEADESDLLPSPNFIDSPLPAPETQTNE